MSMFNKVLFIYNGSAGQTETDRALAAVLPVISTETKELKVVQTEEAGETKKICLKLGEEYDLVIILGGDGTVHEAVNGLAALDKRPVLAILPGGTCNDFSRMLNIPQNLKKAAETIMSGQQVPVDVGKVNDDHYFLNFWGIGLITHTSSNIDENQKRLMGKMSYFISALRTVKEAETFHYKMKTDQGEYEDEAVMIMVLNGKFIGSNQIPLPSINMDDGLFDVLVVKESSFGAFLDLFSLNSPDINLNDAETRLFHLQTKSLSIETEEVLDADTDGEIYLETPATLEILKHHIHMIKGY
ncbi:MULTISPECIES: diacylglycerol kinase family protein [Bacillaceae]|uniref:diacylglycerol/lipid kinase family protein n=1 Tax=Bacillaceae TaxID=186817 RepID=UPI001CEFA415|nr:MULTISPECIES: YegS/Rv2252/BmrU family lipid kinase [Bacillaceae]